MPYSPGRHTKMKIGGIAEALTTVVELIRDVVAITSRTANV